ncbi:protein LONGIFOLIA 1-like [Chenopodium quinoa]|uniref:protein LONGIFOLIA 1-like n=1 Tax=Chenopodium quinoa TaxID=63459 RepID=UPI000B76E96B|nr:protein LONGIFOLIA 1-like [Chenopodium quinoa]
MTTTGITIHDQNLEKQIEKHMGGCMAGFFNLFDRNHLLSGKRLYPKRLPPSISSTAGDSASESISIVGSPPPLSTESEKPKQKPQPDVKLPAPESVPATPNSTTESVKSSPWKFNREAPRLSLDSRAITDAKGGLRPREIRINTVSTSASAADDSRENQRQSPSVIARLMGLEQLPSSSGEPPEKKVELRRSASESRSRDYRFFDTPSFLSPVTTNNEVIGERKSDQKPGITRNQNNNGGKINNIQKVKNHNVNNFNNNNNNNQRRLMVERRSYYDTADFFPPELPVKQQQHQQHQAAVSIYGEIGRRMRMRGTDEPLKDLETLKHILEALQLKGLLHSSTATTTNSRNNRRFSSEEESPVVLMRPARSPVNNRRRNVNNANNASSGESPRRERPARSPMRSPGRNENRSSSPSVRRKGGPLSVETQRRTNETTTTTTMTTSSSSRVSHHSPVHSPKMTPTRRSDQTVNRSPRNRRSTVENCQGDRILSGPAFAEDETSTTISESSFSTASHTDNERWRGEEYRDGRNLLERCDKLLHSIAEITANSNSNSSSAELQQPSPVSVLDSSYYKEDESSPSPVKKRTIDFKDQVVMELEDELLWSPSSIIQLSKLDHDIDSSDYSEFSYVSEVLRASNYLPDDNTNVFLLLEKQSSIRGNKDKSKASILQRKLIFDTITEILDRNRQLPPWKLISISNSAYGRSALEQIWSEFQKIREQGPSEDLFEVICGVLKKDLAEDSVNGWADSPVEMSEAVLDIERMIFKDLIGETIRDLATFAGKSMELQAPCRKLVF